MEMIQSTLVRNLKALRKAKGWNQDQLAEETGYSSGFIKQIETGRSWVSPEALDKICAALDVSCDRLFAIDGAEGKMFDMPMSRAIKKLMNVPDDIYDLAEKLGSQNPIWEEEIIPLLEAAVEDEALARQKKSQQA